MNGFSEAIVLRLAMAPYSEYPDWRMSSKLKGNLDATTVLIYTNGDMVFLPGDVDTSKLLLEGDLALEFSLKIYTLIFRDGYMAPPLFVLGDRTLTEVPLP